MLRFFSVDEAKHKKNTDKNESWMNKADSNKQTNTKIVNKSIENLKKKTQQKNHRKPEMAND